MSCLTFKVNRLLPKYESTFITLIIKDRYFTYFTILSSFCLILSRKPFSQIHRQSCATDKNVVQFLPLTIPSKNINVVQILPLTVPSETKKIVLNFWDHTGPVQV